MTKTPRRLKLTFNRDKLEEVIDLPATLKGNQAVFLYIREHYPPCSIRVLRRRGETMLDSLVSGRIYGTPTRRVGKSGRPFVTAKVRSPMRNNESAFVNVVAFSDAVMTGLLALADGAAVAVSGELTADVWTDKDGRPHAGFNLVARELLTQFHIDRRRRAMQKKPEAPAGEAAVLREWHGQSK